MRHRLVTTLMTLALALGVSSALFGQDFKKHKDKEKKEKRFETVVRKDLKDYEGTYVGIEDDYWIRISVAPGGELRAQCMEDGQAVAVMNVRVTGAHLTADMIYEDGRKVKLDATFSNRILNGESAFGLLVDGLNIRLEGDVILNKVFYRRR